MFGADPLCSSTAWRVLAQATRAWGVRVVVPSVVFAEAVGGYQRSAAEALIGFDRWQTKQRARQLGFEAIAAGVGEAINAQADVFEKTLRTRLDDIGAEIVPVPQSTTPSSSAGPSPGVARATTRATDTATR